MKAILVLFSVSCRRFIANKEAMILTFLVPVVLIYLLGHLFGLHSGSKGPAPSGITLAVVNQSTNPAAVDLINALKADTAFKVRTEVTAEDGSTRPLTEADARADIATNNYRYALILPPDLIPNDAVGVRVKFISDPRNEIEAKTVDGLVQKTVFTEAPQLLRQSLVQSAKREIGGERYSTFSRAMAELISLTFGGEAEDVFRQMVDEQPARTLSAAPSSDAASAESSEEDEMTNLFSELIQIETEQVAGKDLGNPMAARTVGGYAVMFLLFALAGSAASLFEDRQSGIFQRVLSAPVTPSHILWSRFVFGVAVGCIQLTFLFVAGKFFFGLDLLAHAPALLAITLATAAACTAFGMLIAAAAPSQEAASGLTTLLVLPMAAIGGAWFPVTFMPEFIQKLSKLSLVYWAVEAYTSTLWAGHSLYDVLPNIGILSGIAFGVMLLATQLFKRRKMFQ